MFQCTRCCRLGADLTKTVNQIFIYQVLRPVHSDQNKLKMAECNETVRFTLRRQNRGRPLQPHVNC